MSKFLMTRDASGAVDYGLVASNDGSSGKKMIALTMGGGEKTFVLPTAVTTYSVVFSYEPGAKVWVGYGGSAISLPTANFTDTVAELNPAKRDYPGGTTLRFITNDSSAEVGVRFDER